ncbi:MAG TPA: DUF4258 domain-containing protein [Chitinophagales bacterium]|nr:DUF4258 domain-containing protein [Chitinophagales bacterium]
MKNWFIGMILFVLTALVLSVNTTNAAINSPYVQEKATSLFFHNKISQIAFNFIENDLENCCQNARNLVAYRNWVTSAAGNAAKTSTLLVKTGVEISEHAALRMTERGITQKMVETGLSKGVKYFDPKNGTFDYVLKNGFASGKDLLICTNTVTGKVTTVLRGNNLVKSRFIPQ